MKIESLEPQDFSDFWRRLLARLIDSFLSSAIIPMTFQLRLSTLDQKDLWSYLLITLPPYFLWVFLIMRCGGTPGKLLLNMRIVDAKGKFLSFMPACKRMTPEILILLNSVFQMQRIMATFPGFKSSPTIEQLATAINQYGGPYTHIANILSFLFLVDCLLVLFHPRKQSGHDILAGSYVISKPALLNLHSDR